MIKFNFKTSSKYLRHKNLATTMAYLKITTADIQKELEEMGDPVTAIIKMGDI